MTASLRTRPVALLVACCAAVVALAAGCGSGSSSGLPKGSVAVVDGQPISQTRFDAVFDQYCNSLKANKQPCPKRDSDAGKANVQKIAQYLVTRTEFEQQARKLHVTVTAKDIAAAEKKAIDQYFNGSRKKFLAAIKAQHTTLRDVRDNIAFSVLQAKVAKKLTAGIKISNAEALKNYNQNISQYTQPESRKVAHILVAKKTKADSIYTQLQNGASFAKLAKKYSTDTSTKSGGGQLTVCRGQYATQHQCATVPQFEAVAFELKTGTFSKPVKSQYGWHVIKALGPIVPKSVTPFSRAKAQIVQQLLSGKKNDAATAWQDRIQKYYSTRVKYASGYSAPTATTPAATSLGATTPTG